MNIGRILLGGLVAGVVINIGEFLLNEKVLAAQMKEMMAAHNMKQPAGNFIAIAIGDPPFYDAWVKWDFEFRSISVNVGGTESVRLIEGL